MTVKCLGRNKAEWVSGLTPKTLFSHFWDRDPLRFGALLHRGRPQAPGSGYTPACPGRAGCGAAAARAPLDLRFRDGSNARR
jgi:hypothetical protein